MGGVVETFDCWCIFHTLVDTSRGVIPILYDIQFLFMTDLLQVSELMTQYQKKPEQVLCFTIQMKSGTRCRLGCGLVLLEYNSCGVTYSRGCVSRGQRLKCWV